MMKLAKNWEITKDNQFWLILENETDNMRLVFDKKGAFYRVDPIEDFEEDEVVAFWFNYQEQQMISNIINEFRG